ncbi:small-conductance mechanosensitive channel [Rhizobium leguminosarum bv. trifolii WSM2012]|nr:small-conductance mechanosensitive channel [Rhizobium leguminosarum bv. trifolii WSM2012]
MRLIMAGLLALFSSIAWAAQVPSPAPDQKVEQLLRLLDDPDVRGWLENHKPGQPLSDSSANRLVFATWESSIRERVDRILTAVPRVPEEVNMAATRARQEAIAKGYAPVFVIFASLLAIGLAAEMVLRRLVARSGSPLVRLGSIGVFSSAMTVIFFAVDWPPLARLTLLAYICAFIVIRLAVALMPLTALSPGRRLRLSTLTGIVAVAIATSAIAGPLGVDPDAAGAISVCFSLIVLALAVETVWSTMEISASWKAAAAAFAVVLWIAWCLDMKGLFWLGIYAVVLPRLLKWTALMTAALSPDAGGLRHLLITHGVRAAIVGLAVGWQALVWRLNPDAPGRQDPWIAALVYAGLKSVVVLLLADLVWQLVRHWIDRALRTASDTTSLSPADAARRARFRTLLPIFRNAIAVVVLVIAGLIVLSQLGVQIGPLLAGAGVFGVAIGFGSQTLVKDIIGGVFYMLDDAFRVGEYIQAKDYKGTVEGFSLRSVRLRHHRGPVFTVPFGELGAVENMSRDWVIDKFRISVGYDTDIETARKLTKKIGAELKADAELGPLFIEPLKMKGVEEFGDYGIVLSFGMTTVPGMQTYIRRKAYAKLREAFLANGITFAHPTVQVGGDDKLSGAAAAQAAVRAQQARAATPSS